MDVLPEWSDPKRILLLTYDRLDHVLTTYANMLVGVPGDRGSITKASRVRRGDWALIRVSSIPEFMASRPAMILDKPRLPALGDPAPEPLWEAETESQKVIYPLRIPVLFEGGPKTKPGCINWETMAGLGFRGKDGYRLETPQQWGIKFSCNVLEDPVEVSAFVALIKRCVL